jgi:type II secretory ATPase GspE/PulE/Tfp pilus assembly ATPase PilB-like protein/phage FluMu protein Com
MAISFHCKSCGQGLKVPDSVAGKHTKCPKCKNALVVPGAETPPPDRESRQTGLAGRSEAWGKLAEPDTTRIPDFDQEERRKWILISAAGVLGVLALISLAMRAYCFYFWYLSPAGKSEMAALMAAGGDKAAYLSLAAYGLELALSLTVLSGVATILQGKFGGQGFLVRWLKVVIAVQALHFVLLKFVPALALPENTSLPIIPGTEATILGLTLVAGIGFVLFFSKFTTRPALVTQGPDSVVLVHELLREALDSRASDLHIEPSSAGSIIRYRIDGMLHKVASYSQTTSDRITSRIKVLAEMDIAEKREPQDGGATVQLNGRDIDLRVSTVPSDFGERVVIRLLDPRTGVYGVESLGLAPDQERIVSKILQSSHGVFFCTGPTGSGKSTTLYAALRQQDNSGRNVITIEDPIEYHLPGITQLQVGEKKGMTFAAGLRSLLRQDPDVILVGEVRDTETADMVIRSSQTGHLVLSTLHTNDSAGAVSRLLDLEIDPALLASSLLAVLAQRLVRQICPHCKESYTPDANELYDLGLPPSQKATFHRGGGCEKCLGTGYIGRLGLFELMIVDETVRALILERADSVTIKNSVIGMMSLKADGARKVLAGLTTTAEVQRVTQVDLHQ